MLRARGKSTDSQRETATLKSLITQLTAQRTKETAKLNALPKTREPVRRRRRRRRCRPERRSPRPRRDLGFGRYYALLIGNQSYKQLQSLETPRSDVARAKEILEDKYGFVVSAVTDGDNSTVMKAVNDLNDLVGENDNLLLFYAGPRHPIAERQERGGLLVPSNAERRLETRSGCRTSS